MSLKQFRFIDDGDIMDHEHMIAYDILGNIHGSQRRTWDFSYQHTDAFFRKSTYEFHGLLAEIRPIASTIFPSFCDHPILGYHPIWPQPSHWMATVQVPFKTWDDCTWRWPFLVQTYESRQKYGLCLPQCITMPPCWLPEFGSKHRNSGSVTFGTLLDQKPSKFGRQYETIILNHSKVTWNILEHMSIQSLDPNFIPICDQIKLVILISPALFDNV